MVKWTEHERSIIHDLFDHLDYEDAGPKALVRCLIVYPWTQRYFGKFGKFKSADDIKHNAQIAAHGVKMLRGLDLALKDMDHINESYVALSVLHAKTLHVDPDNFRLLSDCLTHVVAAKMGHSFTPEIQATLQKFMATVASALGRQCY